MIISGVGGYSHNETPSSDVFMAKELKFRSVELGCVKIKIEKDCMAIKFFNLVKKVIYEFKIKKL